MQTLASMVGVHMRAHLHDWRMQAASYVAFPCAALGLQNTTKDNLRVHDVQGQDGLVQAWDMLIKRCDAALVLVDHSAPDPLQDLDYHLEQLRLRRPDGMPIVVGVTRLCAQRPLTIYNRHLGRTRCACSHCRPPVFEFDSRSTGDVRITFSTLLALVEMEQRFDAVRCRAG